MEMHGIGKEAHPQLAAKLKLLSQGTMAEMAGISTSFNRVFREEKGMAPGEYRALFVGLDKNEPAKK